MTMPGGIIDSDVHCEVPDVAALMPYLPRHWRARLTENAWVGPAGVTHCYPRPVAGDRIASLQQLRERVLTPEVERVLLTCYYGVEMIRHPDLGRDLASAVNGWLKTEWLDEEPRVAATLVVPIDYPQAAAEELRRWRVEDGFVQVLFPVVSQRTYGNRAYFPIYEAAQERGFVIGLHFGGVSGAAPTPSGWPDLYIEESAGMAHVFQGQILSLIAEGVFQEFPALRFSVLESGVTWLPSLLWRLDKMWKSYRREIPWVQAPPSTYLRDRMRATLMPLDVPSDPRLALDFVQKMELEELLLFATDCPHEHGWDPAEMLALLEPDRREPILAGNARAWYGFG